MAHNKVYGVCQNKCSVEVSPKSEKFERVYYTNPGILPLTVYMVFFHKYALTLNF